MSRSMMHFIVFLVFALAATFFVLKKADQAAEDIDRIQSNIAYDALFQASRELRYQAATTSPSTTRSNVE